MKKLFLIVFFLFFSKEFYAQNNEQKEDTIAYSAAALEFQPEFPGGSAYFVKYINKNYKLPNVKGLKGKVIIEFVVEKDGSISDAKVLRDIGYGTGNEAVRILTSSPLWKAGMLNGKPVRARFVLPINIDVK